MAYGETVEEFKTLLGYFSRMWEKEPSKYAELIQRGHNKAMKYNKKRIVDMLESMFKEVLEGCS